MMAAQPNIGGALCGSSVILQCKCWMMPAARVPCSNAANIREHKIGRKVNFAPGKIPSGGNSFRKCIYTVSQKKRPTLTTCYNFYIHSSIATIFGINVAKKVGNQNVLYFPTTPN